VSPVRYELVFYIPEDHILHSHCRENLKSYIWNNVSLTSTLVVGDCSASSPFRFSPRGKSPRYPMDNCLGEPQSQSRRYGESHGDSNPDPYAIAISTELPRFCVLAYRQGYAVPGLVTQRGCRMLLDSPLADGCEVASLAGLPPFTRRILAIVSVRGRAARQGHSAA
jgi:hypothetical protein